MIPVIVRNTEEMLKVVPQDLREASYALGIPKWKTIIKIVLPTAASGIASGIMLAIARDIAVEPEVLLMDEPCSALDPISTLAIEDLMSQLKENFTIVIVTHNMQQAARVSDDTAFFNLEETGKPGQLVEVGPTSKIFSNPDNKATEDYISGRFG